MSEEMAVVPAHTDRCVCVQLTPTASIPTDEEWFQTVQTLVTQLTSDLLELPAEERGTVATYTLVQASQARLLTMRAVRNMTMLKRDAKRLKKKSLQVFGTEYPLGVCQQAMAVSRGFTSFIHLEAMSAKLSAGEVK